MKHASHIAFFASFFDFRGPVGADTVEQVKKFRKRTDEPLWLGEARSLQDGRKINAWVFIGSKDQS